MNSLAPKFVLASMGFLLCACGYRVGGKADTVPKAVRTIAVPAFGSFSNDYKIGDLLANDISREFTERTRFQIVRDAGSADAVLKGTVTNLVRYPALADPTSGKTTSIQLLVFLTITLTERSTGKVLYSRPNFLVKEFYELSTDPHQIIDQSGPAFQRLSLTVARDVVSAVMEGF
jgi:hypothetical protein